MDALSVDPDVPDFKRIGKVHEGSRAAFADAAEAMVLRYGFCRVERGHS
jgi:hypothetical protein